MRLINTSSLRMANFSDNRSLPGYAILSHCWAADSDEVSYQDFHSLHFGQQSIGWRKITMFCELARQNGAEWAWVDTCCIDKTSSAELTEAINSMYTWYELSAVCYVFLPDVNAQSQNLESNVQRTTLYDSDGNDGLGSLCKSRWFTRGWTLQELLAPARVEFFDTRYNSIGTKSELSAVLAEITGIDKAYLDRKHGIREASVAARMSWASERQTKRIEDIAYSLLGIFNVNMPLIYGEGDKAFMRLQLAIIAQSDDCTILAWNCNEAQEELCGTLAPSPDCFVASSDIVDTQGLHSNWPGGFESTNKGLHYWYPLVGPEVVPTHILSYSYWSRLGVTQQIQLNCRDATSNQELILHVARQGNKWYRAGIEKQRTNLASRYAYRTCATLLPYRRKYISTSNPNKSAVVWTGHKKDGPASGFTSPSFYRFIFIEVLTITVAFLAVKGLDPTVLVRIALLQLAMEISPDEMRAVWPMIWISHGFVLRVFF